MHRGILWQLRCSVPRLKDTCERDFLIRWQVSCTDKLCSLPVRDSSQQCMYSLPQINVAITQFKSLLICGNAWSKRNFRFRDRLEALVCLAGPKITLVGLRYPYTKIETLKTNILQNIRFATHNYKDIYQAYCKLCYLSNEHHLLGSLTYCMNTQIGKMFSYFIQWLHNVQRKLSHAKQALYNALYTNYRIITNNEL